MFGDLWISKPNLIKMNYFRKNSIQKPDSFFYTKFKNKTPNQRYSDIELPEPVLDPNIENISTTFDYSSIKPWLLQNLKEENYDLIFHKLFNQSSTVDKSKFIKELKQVSSHQHPEEFLLHLLQIYNLPVQTRSDKFASQAEYSKLINLNPKKDDIIGKILKNFEIKLEPIRLPKRLGRTQAKDKLSEIFEFFAADYYRKKRLKNPVDKKTCFSISLEYFLHFCKCFNFSSFQSLSQDNLIAIFKKNSLYYKVMRLEHFIESLHDIFKLAFPLNTKVDKLFEFMGLDNEDYKKKLIEKEDCLNFSKSEKSLNQTLNKKISRKSGTTKHHERRIVEGKLPKTSCNKTRTPITWKYLNEIDISELGEEFDVRREIFPRLINEKKINSVY